MTCGNQLRCVLTSTFLLVILFIPFLSGLGVPPSLRPQQTSPNQTPTAIEKAESSLMRGQPEEAIQTLSTYLQTHPNDTAARLALGKAWLIAGQHDRAEAEFQAVLRTAPNNYLALMFLGEMYDRTGHPEKAEPILRRAVELSRGKPETRMEWAVVLARLHRYKEAHRALAGLAAPSSREGRISFYRLKASVALGLGNPSAAASEMEKALALKPDDMGLNVATAAAELQAKNWERAVSLAEPVFSRTHDPGTGLVILEAQLAKNVEIGQTLKSLRATILPPNENGAFHQRVAEALAANGRFSESIEDFSKAADLDPKRPDLLFNLAVAQFKAVRLDDALQSAEKCKGLGDNAELEALLGDIQESRGDYLAAVRSYQAAVALAPAEEKYHLSLTVEFIRHENFEAAKVVLKKAEQLRPSSWRVQLALGMVEFFAGSDQEAGRILLHAADLAPEPATALRYLGDIQMDLASPPDTAALNRLCQYSEHHPNDGKAQFHCGALMFRRDYLSGNKSRTAEILRRLHVASERLPQDALPHCQLGRVYRWMEKWPEARDEAETCVRMDASSAEAHYRLAQIYQKTGQKELADQEMKIYETAAEHLADENERRRETMRTFLYTIQKEGRNPN